SQQQQQPTVDDIIDWHLEQCYNCGELGFTCEPPTIEAFNANIRINPTPAPFGDDPLDDDDWADIDEAAARDAIKEFNRAKDRHEYIISHPALVAETQKEVHRRLLAAGKRQSDIDLYDVDQIPLRLRILDLHNIENGYLEKTVPASLNYVSGSIQRSTKTNLNAKDSLSDFERHAKCCLESLKTPYTQPEGIHYEGRPWRYRLNPTPWLYQNDFRILESNRDYQNMISTALKYSCALVLTQEEQHEPEILTQEEQQEPDILTSHLSSAEQEENPPLISAGLLESFKMLGTREIDMDNRAFLADFAAEARAQRASSNEEMIVSRARRDEARVARDNDRQARRAESLAAKDEDVPQTRAIREGWMTETGHVEQVREDDHGPQSPAMAQGAAAAGPATSPKRKSARIAAAAAKRERLVAEQAALSATSSKAQPPPSEGKKTPLKRSASKRGKGKAANASSALSRTRSGEEGK
ncbi:MAG: hypothetical protein LQ352_004481, partial [Teloschistes flavicans]